MKQQNLLAVFFLVFFASSVQAQVDMIMFSFNRPLQLYAALESINIQIKNLSNIYVLYRTGNQEYEAAYNEVQADFPHVTFVKQEVTNEFKSLVLKCFHASTNPYIIFTVDDGIITGPFDMGECADALKKTGAYGFYLTLGQNITQNSFNYVPIQVPQLTKITDTVYRFRFDQGDWNYPNNLVMTLYLKSDIESFFTNTDYYSPNTLEGSWAGKPTTSPLGLCFYRSMTVTTPLNLVQRDWQNPCYNSFSPELLLKKWNEGFKMDILPFFSLHYSVPHISVTPTFILRNSFAVKK